MVELRVPEYRQGTRSGTASGYYDDLDKLAHDATAIDSHAPGLYVTLNRVNPACLARRKNRMQTGGRMATTEDTDIIRRLWLPFDLDAIRPSETSSTDEEHAAAIKRAQDIKAWLMDNGWPQPLILDSGNGSWTLFPVDLPVDDEHNKLVDKVARLVSQIFTDGVVKVDTSVLNPSRIFKLPGTMVCKGDNMPDRSHRRSMILEYPAERVNVTVDQLKSLAVLADQLNTPKAENKPGESQGLGVSAQELLDQLRCQVVSERRARLGTIAKLDECPWNHNHKRSAWILWDDNGQVLAAGCPHNSCHSNENRVIELLDQYMPGWKDRKKQDTNKPQGKTSPSKNDEADDQNDEIDELVQQKRQRKVEAKLRPKAMDIMRRGDPIGFILRVYNSLHVGDENHGKLLLGTIGCQSVSNSDGMHPDTSGESGSGKSHSHKSMAHLVPPEYLICASVSPKALFYADLKPSTVVYLDDLDTIDPMLAGVIKRSTSDYQKYTEHLTVDDKRRKKKLYMPPRLAWWITSVDSDFDMQVLNRFLSLTVDDTIAHKRDIMRWQLERAGTGTPELPENEDVWTCREIIRILKEQLFEVVIPYWHRIEWNNPENSRNLPMFLDTIRGFAAFRHMQRERGPNGSVIATVEDYEDAKKLWSTIKENQVSKLTRAELALLDALKRIGGEADVNKLQKEISKSRSTILTTLNGRDGRSGLLSKVPQLKRQDITEGESSDGRFLSKSKKIYTLPTDFNILENFQEIVHLKPDPKDPKGCRAGDDTLLKQETKELRSSVETVESNSIIQDKETMGQQPIAQPITVQQRDTKLPIAEEKSDSPATLPQQAQQSSGFVAKGTPLDERMKSIMDIVRDYSKENVKQGMPKAATEKQIIDYRLTYGDSADTTRACIKKLLEIGELMRPPNYPYYYMVTS